jgi:peptidoglycan hydrolase-like protein with peptidoglycan-binding domain
MTAISRTNNPATARPVAPSRSSGANSILFKLTTAGASNATASQDGIRSGGASASAKLAQNDLSRLKKYSADFEAVGKKYGFPPALLAAIASRESRGGAALDSRGFGDHGHGFGLMQVDDGTAAPKGGPYSREHIDHGASILKGKLDEVKRAHPDWSPEMQLKGAVAAYNAGASNVRTQAGMDRGTTGNDYSNDVWERAKALAPSFGGTSGASSTGGTTTGSGRPQGSGDSFGTPSTSKPGVLGGPTLAQSELISRGDKGDKVEALQKMLKANGANIEVDGDFGPKTEAALKAFQTKNGLAADGIYGPLTESKARGASGASSGGTSTTSQPATTQGTGSAGGKVNPNNPLMQKLANSHLDNGPTGMCVATTLNNMERLGVRNFPGGTAADPNNPRGAMVRLMREGGYTSLPLPGSKERTITSPAFGTVKAQVISADAYEKMAKAGQIPSGAIIFQTRHGWDYSGGSSGNDMGIVRNGGRQTHNYATMGPIIYGDAKEVVLLVPKEAMQNN